VERFTDRGGGREGFTLLEVVAALAIVGLGVVTFLQVFSQGLRLGAASVERAEAMARAQAILDEKSARGELREGEQAGALPGGERWSLRVARLRDESDPGEAFPWKLASVTLEMNYRAAGRDRSVTLHTLRLTRRQGP
jgi:prepilin-type N-terminal cleavage/methylation domain-containing protein